LLGTVAIGLRPNASTDGTANSGLGLPTPTRGGIVGICTWVRGCEGGLEIGGGPEGFPRGAIGGGLSTLGPGVIDTVKSQPDWDMLRKNNAVVISNNDHLIVDSR